MDQRKEEEQEKAGNLFTGFDEMRRQMERQFEEQLRDIQTKAPKELIREYQTPEGGKVRRQNHNMQKSRISSSSASKPSDYVRYAPSTILKAGTPAPDFTLHTTPDQKVSLSEFRDRPTILAFYPADWSPVCGDEMTLFNEILP